MTIKLHLEAAEVAPLERTAAAFGCSVEDVLYTALNEYMLRIGDFKEQCGPECRKIHTDMNAMRAQVLNTKSARKDNLPRWADSASSVHNYEGRGPEYPTKSTKSAF